MAKLDDYDFSDFDEPTDSAPAQEYDFSDFDEPAKDTAPDYSKQEVSQPEAFGIGAIQGSTFGTAPLASGFGGAVMNGIEQLGDKLGLTTDSKLEKEGFTIADKKTGLEGLMSEYYDSRNRMKGLQDASADQHPITTIAGNIAGSAPAAGAALFGVASKAGLAAKVAAGAKEGAAMGALNSFGSGDAKLADGEVYDSFREVTDGAVGGALVGGGLPIAGAALKGTAGLITDLPIAKQVKTAFKGGRAGIKLDEDSAGNAIKTYSEDLLNTIQSQFRKAGLSKANAMDYADEIGVRVNAGEAFQEVMDDVMSRKALTEHSKKDKESILNLYKELKNGPANKLQDKTDLARAKMQQKMEAKGYTLLDETQQNGNVQDFLPESGSDKNINLAKQKYQKIDQEVDLLEDALGEGEKKLSKPVDKLIQQVGDNSEVPVDSVDIENLSIRDIRDLMNEVNVHTGDLMGGAKGLKEESARKLATQLKQLRDEALDNAGADSSGNQSLHKTFAALDRAGIDDNVLTNSPIRKDAMVDKLRNTVTAGNPIDRQRMFQYLEEASPQGYKGFKEGAEFLNDFNDLAKQVKPLNSTNALGLLGSAKNIGLSAANKAGAMSQGLTKLVDMPAEKLGQIAQKLGMSQNKAAQQFASPLLKASQSDDRKRSAILYGLYQQPAFRQMYEELGQDVNDTILPVGTDRDEQN